LLLPVSRWDDLLELPSRFISNGLLPSALEFWDPLVLQHLRESGPDDARRLKGEALAILEFDDIGCTSETFLNKVMELTGPISESIQVASDAHQREVLWNIRRQTSVLLKELFPHKISEDIAVPRSKIKAFYEGVDKLKIHMATYGHLGDGNLHVNLLTSDSSEYTERSIMNLFRLVLDLGGTLTGEHGIGLAKRNAFLTSSDPWQIQAIRAIKNVLDPSGIFNAGKVI
jgi:FAD/FMN-containing dehydrogenase